MKNSKLSRSSTIGNLFGRVLGDFGEYLNVVGSFGYFCVCVL
jgi:hypothetical protein